MTCSCCAFANTADQHFNTEKVAKELRQYRRKGPGPTTRGLRDGLLATGLAQGTVLDIGGGLGILSLELLAAGLVGPSSLTPRLRTSRLRQKRQPGVVERRQQSSFKVISWSWQASWRPRPWSPSIAWSVATRSMNRCSSRRCSSQTTVFRVLVSSRSLVREAGDLA